MDKYENLGLVGEGSYGMVLKCKHKDTGQIVAIKKYLENEDDKTVKKIAMREIKMLKLLRHDHLVNLIEVFRRKRRLYLVFEFMDHTVLDELEKYPHGLDELSVRKMLWQVLKGIEFCHVHNVIHRDIKPENILVNKSGIVKVCDFGFARTLGLNSGEMYTDYVATRWYRAPELLVGETKYGKAVDTWAVGCLLGEMLCGDPLFPGESDIDQLYHVIKCFGNLIPHHREIFSSNPLFRGLHLPEMKDQLTLQKKCPKISLESLDLMKLCLSLDPSERPSSTLLLRHTFFHKDGFFQRFPQEIRLKLQRLNQKHSSGLKKQKSNESIKSDEKESKKKKREKEKLKESEQKSKKKHNEHEKVGNSMLPSMATNGLFQEPAPNCQMTGDFTTEKSDHSPPKYYCGMTLPNVLLPYKKSDIGLKKDQIVDNSKKQMLGPLHTFNLSPHHKTVVSDKKKGKEPSRKDNLCLPKVDQTEGSKSKERNFEKSNITSVPHMPTFEPFPCNLIFTLFNRREMRGV